MSRRSPQPLRQLLHGAPALLVVALLAPPSSAAYEVHRFTGDSFVVELLTLVDGQPSLLTENGLITLEVGEIDFYATFRANLGDESGNVVVFETGRFLRHEGIELVDGRAIIEVGEGSKLVVDEGLIDFRASVLEGATIELPEGVGELSVARSDGGVPRTLAARRAAARARSQAAERQANEKTEAERQLERRRRALERVREARERRRSRTGR